MNIMAQKVLLTIGVATIATVAVVRTVGLLGHIVNEAYDAVERQVDKTFNRR